MSIPNIQFDLFTAAPALSREHEIVELLRPHKWATGQVVELALITIELAPHGDRWMWSSSLNSHNGSGQGGRALPQFNRFAPTKAEALIKGVDDVRQFMHRATSFEQKRITAWLKEQMSRAAGLTI